MAEEDQEENEVAEGEQPEKSKKKKWLLLGGALFLLIAISVAATLYFWGFFSDEETAEQLPEEPVEEVSAAVYYPLKPAFITNFDVRGRQRFMQAELTLMLRDNSLVPAIELHMPAIRHTLGMLMRGQDYRELQTPEGKELLRQRALLEVQEVLQQEIDSPGVEQVLFTNLVLQ